MDKRRIVLLGATGFTGQQVLGELLARGELPTLVGRSRDRLLALAGGLEVDLPVEQVDVSSPTDLVDAASPGTGISVPGSFVVTLDPARGNLTVSASTSISSVGPGSATVDGALGTRVFHITSTAIAVTMSGLTVRHGSPASTDPHSDTGGGILNEGSLTLNDVVVTSNNAENAGGVANFARLTVNGGQVTGNEATRSPGSAGGLGSGSNTFLTVSGTRFSDNKSSFGGAINTYGITALTAVTMTHNSTTLGGGGLSAGLPTPEFTAPDVTVVDSTIADNATAGSGGGIFLGDGRLAMTGSTISGNEARSGSVGGAFVTNSSAILTNDTISENRAGQGGGGIAQNSFVVPRGVEPIPSERAAPTAQLGFLEPPAERGTPKGAPSASPSVRAGPSQDDVTLGWVTLAMNSGATGGGILNGTGFAFSAHDTIVAANSAASDANCSGTVSSGGYNLESADDCRFSGAGDISNTDPLLAGLASNGGAMQTMALQSSSPAVDSGDPACPPPGTDQRGFTRPQGPACDIGAFESTLLSPPSTGRQPPGGSVVG